MFCNYYPTIIWILYAIFLKYKTLLLSKYLFPFLHKLIISIILRVLLSTVFSVLIFSIILSLIVSKFDLPLELTDYLTVIITSLSAVTISFISTIGIKNNGLMIGLISQIPLIIYSLANAIIFDNPVLIFIVKLFISTIYYASFIGIIKVYATLI